MTYRLEIAGVPISYEADPETGEITAFNDELRVMVIGPDRETARRLFDEAVAAQVSRDLRAGRPLHPRLRERVSTYQHS